MGSHLEGGCACGAVRYRLTAEPMIVHCCHCLNCQRQTGSAFVINVVVETDRVELLAGEPVPVPVPAFEVYYDPADVWSPESRARYAALSA